MSFLFFKPKTAYEMRMSDWSSDVCSSDLGKAEEGPRHQILRIARSNVTGHRVEQVELLLGAHQTHQRRTGRADRQMPCPGSDVELRRPFCAQASRSTMA